MQDESDIPHESDFIDAITNGDENRLRILLQDQADPALFAAAIANPQPTNHSIGFGMTLLQLAAIRTRKNGNPADVLIGRQKRCQERMALSNRNVFQVHCL